MSAPPCAAVIWLTGFSGAGKSTIAQRVAERLTARGEKVEILDGDVIRALFPHTGFTRQERDAHVRHVGFLASRLEDHGVVVIAALISPFAQSRAFVRDLCHNFVEVHVSTPLSECERRDVKGLYAQARQGRLCDFTGIDAPYEAPLDPDVAIDTTHLSVDDSSDQVMQAIERCRRAAAADGDARR